MNANDHLRIHPAPMPECLVCALLKRRAADVRRNRRWRERQKALGLKKSAG